eukprot:SAG31_NODE_259_length_18917_cov_28.559677_4_plen_202_part_00
MAKLKNLSPASNPFVSFAQAKARECSSSVVAFFVYIGVCTCVRDRGGAPCNALPNDSFFFLFADKPFYPGARAAAMELLNAGVRDTNNDTMLVGMEGVLGLLDLASHSPPKPGQVEASVVIDSVLEIDELAFTFGTKFKLVLSWYDTAIFRSCTAYGYEKVYADFAEHECPEVWVPRVRFLNARELECAYNACVDYPTFDS